MADPIKIDSHIHVFARAEDGIESKQAYEIWEYGRQDEVVLSELAGTVEDLLEAMRKAGIAKAVALHIFAAVEERRKQIDALPPGLAGSERDAALARIEARLADDLKAFNRWACQVSQAHPEIIPYVCADVAVLSAEDCAGHFRDLAANHGARGIKLHGPSQGFHMGDERLWPTYEVCREHGLPVIGHSGPDRDGNGFAEPRAFGAVLAAFPEVTVVLAHMGGATWSQCLEIAESYPNAFFDCCEVMEWTHSERGPSDRELAQLIKDIGPGRVMMGSDFPWYDLDRSVDRVMDLPLLSNEQKEGIIGANAVRILGL